jgi:hypothetical protein
MGRKAGKQIDFSIVVPVKDEVDLIPRTLPSYYAVNSSEVIVCTNKPTPRKVRQVIQKVAVACDALDITRIVEVERDPEWIFHQAHVRRAGFHKAKYDRILTGDIDLVVNKNILKAVELVGENNVGLVSLNKFWYPRTLVDYWGIGIVTFLRKILHGLLDPVMTTSSFSGLYAIWRSYWLDSEPQEEVKRLVNPKQIYRGERPNLKLASVIAGEDAFLHNCIIKKHKVIYLRAVGAVDLGIPTHKRPHVQYIYGQHFARQGRSFIVSLARAILRAEPYYLHGYLNEKYKR